MRTDSELINAVQEKRLSVFYEDDSEAISVSDEEQIIVISAEDGFTDWRNAVEAALNSLAAEKKALDEMEETPGT